MAVNEESINLLKFSTSVQFDTCDGGVSPEQVRSLLVKLPPIADEVTRLNTRLAEVESRAAEAQERLLNSTALIVGAGGLGSPAALYLAAAGIGHIVLADGDTVDFTNLQRQILHREDRVDQPKAQSGRTTMLQINPQIDGHDTVTMKQ